MTKIYFEKLEHTDDCINIHGIDSISGKFALIEVRASYEIEHTGKNFQALGYDTSKMCYIWPVEEFIARWEPWLTTVEIKLLIKLNPNGQTEGVNPVGTPEDLVERRNG